MRRFTSRAAALSPLLTLILFLAPAAPARAVPTTFRMSSLYLRDPHVYVGVSVLCLDVTDTGYLGNPSLNQQLNTALTSDTDGDGYLDLSPLLIFDPLQQSAPTGDMVFHNGLCTAPLAGTTCVIDSLNPIGRTTVVNQLTGTCLAPRAGTTRPYSPPVASPAGPCFVTDAITLNLDLSGIPVSLRDGQAAATYAGGDPATSLASGLLMGFLSETDADAIIIPADIPLIGGHTLASLLPGGSGSCSSHDDRDYGTDGVTRGWWFYFNYTADPVPLAVQTSVASATTTPALRFYPAMPNPFTPVTTFAYALAAAGPVRLEIYDSAGRRVATLADGREVAAGRHSVDWDGRDDLGGALPGGVYFARIHAAGASRTQKLLIAR